MNSNVEFNEFAPMHSIVQVYRVSAIDDFFTHIHITVTSPIMKTRIFDYKDDYIKLYHVEQMPELKNAQIAPMNSTETQTEVSRLAAVRQNGRALRFIDGQTEAICLAAVQKTGAALQFVKKQTETICLAAVQQNVAALKFVNSNFFNL